MHLLTIAAFALLLQDATNEEWYGKTVQQLAGMNREAEDLLAHGKLEQASAIIAKGQPLESRLLSVPRPTLAAMEAASDCDHLYGRTFLLSHNYVWARMMFQKNLARWKNWMPQTPDTARRLKQAQDAIAECERKMDSHH